MSDAEAEADVDVDTEAEADVDGDWLDRDRDEEVRWAAHPRLTSVLPSVAVGLALVAAGVVGALWVTPALAALAPVGVLLAAWQYLAVTNTRFVVTTEALYVKTGVVGLSVTRLGLDKVQNSSFSQGVRGSLFGYGSVDVEAAGGPGVRFYRIESPQAVRRMVDRIAGGDGDADGDADAIPGTAEEWEAVLAEVRALRSALD